MEVRGMQPALLIQEPDRVRFDRLLNVVMAEPAVVELRLSAPNRAGTYRATMLMMPLRSDFGDINRVIGCTSGEGDLFAPPLSFAIDDVAVTPVEPSQGAEPKQLMPGFADAQAGFTAAPAPTGPKLHAIDGNPNAAPKPREGGARKFRVIDGK
jgi:hypothetical protein